MRRQEARLEDHSRQKFGDGAVNGIYKVWSGWLDTGCADGMLGRSSEFLPELFIKY